MLAHPCSLALLLSAGLLTLTGCAVGPDYRAPEIALSSAFLGQEGVARRQAQHKADLRVWWAAFDDPLLTHFVSLALEQNLDIAQAAARVAQSRASLHAADAALLPAADVSASAARAYQSLETPAGQALGASPGFDRSGSAYEANLGASWEIDLFGGLRREREAARAAYAASEAGAVATRLAVAAQTADVYVTIRGLQARLAIARQQVETRRQLLAMVRLQYEKGIAAELQMNQAEGSLTQAEAPIPILEAGLDAAMNALDVLLGVPPGTYRAELAPAGSVPVPVPVAPGLAETGNPAEMIRRRPDLIVAERRLAAANALIGAAASDYYPSSRSPPCWAAPRPRAAASSRRPPGRPRASSACAGACSTSAASTRRSPPRVARRPRPWRPTGWPCCGRPRMSRTPSPPSSNGRPR